MFDEGVGDRLADGLVVEGDIEIDLGIRDRPVIGDDLHALRLRLLDQRGGSGGIDRVDDDDLGALGDHRVELLLLARGIGIGILVEDLAGRAELCHLGLEARIVVLLVAGRSLVGHQEGHGGAVRALSQCRARSERQGQHRKARHFP